MKRSPGSRSAGLLALAVVLGSVVGCQSDNTKAERPIACGMLGARTVKTMAGTTDLFSSGGLGGPGEISECQVVASSNSKVYLQLSAVDKPQAETQKMLAEEKRTIKRCTSLTDLPGGGYLCVRADQTDAAIALPQRFVRIIVTDNSRTEAATAANVVTWAQEIDDRISKHDVDGSS